MKYAIYTTVDRVRFSEFEAGRLGEVKKYRKSSIGGNNLETTKSG